MKDFVGRVIDGKYRLLRLIGEGGMGAVYEAEHVRISRKVAIKVMLPEANPDPVTRDRFLREAEAASAIGHPNIIEVHDVGVEEDGTAFIVMELLRGKSLEEVLDEQGVVEHSRAVVIAVQVLSALAEAHRKGIVHRDIKPDNVFIAMDGRMRQRIKVIDFGVAKFSEQADPALGLTRPGTVLGTPYYLAPEQARGLRDIDHRIDIWSVGVVLYEMITGRRPFEGENYNEVLGKILMEAHTPVAFYAPDAPPGLIAVIDRALAKERSERYQHVHEMIDDLLGIDDNIRNEVDTQVFQVIERLRSIPPPPASRPAGAPVAAPPSERGRSDSEVLARTLPADGRRLLAPGAVAGSLLLAAAVVVAIVLSGSGEAPIPVEPEDSPADTGIPGPDPGLPETVRIEVTGAPAGAVFSVNGAPLPVPGTLPRSGDPTRLRAEAPGYLPLEILVIPSVDLLLEMRMTEKPAADEIPADEPKGTKSRKPPKHERKSGWLPSPFD